MLARAFLMTVLGSGALYGVFWLITCTPYFKNPSRIRRILARSILAFASIALTVATLAFIIAVERH
jgi:predicted ferric reductase